MTAPDLLQAVDVDWKKKKQFRHWLGYFSTGGEAWHYTGPALDTPELDAILLVAAQQWLRAEARKDILIQYTVGLRICALLQTPIDQPPSFYFGLVYLNHPTPGHALARAIKEVSK